MARELKPAEFRAWRAFLDAQACVMRHLEAELVAADGTTLAEYDVLIQLRVAKNSQLRMSELAERVRLSPSGITRLVDRLARKGLVKRGRCASDRRGTWAILTTGGRERVERLTPIHLGGVRQHFARHLPATELKSLTVALERLSQDRPPQVSSTL